MEFRNGWTTMKLIGIFESEMKIENDMSKEGKIDKNHYQRQKKPCGMDGEKWQILKKKHNIIEYKNI